METVILVLLFVLPILSWISVSSMIKNLAKKKNYLTIFVTLFYVILLTVCMEVYLYWGYKMEKNGWDETKIESINPKNTTD